MEHNHIIVYRSQWEYERDQFWRENPELAFWLFFGIIGIILFTLFASWAHGAYRKYKQNKFNNSVGLFNKRP